MVTRYNHSRDGGEGTGGCAYFRSKFIDHLDRVLDITSVNGVLDVDASLNEFIILRFMSNVRFFRETSCRGGKAFAYEIVHNDGIDVPAMQSKG